MTTLEKLLFWKAAGGGSPLYERTIINNPASFTTEVAKPLKGLSIPFLPIQAGTGDPSPDNVRPITGWTGCNIYRTGENLLPQKTVELGKPGDRTISVLLGMVLLPGMYHVSYNQSGTFNGKAGIQFFNSENQNVGSVSQANGNVSITGKAVRAYIYFPQENYDNGETVMLDNMMMNTGTMEETYEPYSCTTIPVSWQSEAGEVYGGALDALTGLLTVTHKKLVFDGTETWSFTTGTDSNRVIKSVSEYTGQRESYPPLNYMKSASKGAWSGYVSTVGNLVCRIATAIDSTEAWSAYLEENPLEMVVELATPQTVQLDPVTLSTLIGENVIWTDTNSDNTIVYLSKTQGGGLGGGFGGGFGSGSDDPGDPENPDDPIEPDNPENPEEPVIDE